MLAHFTDGTWGSEKQGPEQASSTAPPRTWPWGYTYCQDMESKLLSYQPQRLAKEITVLEYYKTLRYSDGLIISLISPPLWELGLMVMVMMAILPHGNGPLPFAKPRLAQWAVPGSRSAIRASVLQAQCSHCGLWPGASLSLPWIWSFPRVSEICPSWPIGTPCLLDPI